MHEHDPPLQTSPPANGSGTPPVPPGNHPLEVAARRGFGPLSPLAARAWHGNARPCVTCGQLVPRDALVCDHCGQDLSPAMIEKMRAHAGPWYVLEHVRPFPGVSLDRIVRQIRRGLITETSIVRGPATDYQWRFAVETPGLCRYFSRCWQCHRTIAPSDARCPHCLAYLSFEQPKGNPNPHTPAASAVPSPPSHVDASAGQGGKTRPSAGPTASVSTASPVARAVASKADPAAPPVSGSLAELSQAVRRVSLPDPDDIWDEPPRIGGIRATWVALGVVVVMILGLVWFTTWRLPPHESSPKAPVVKNETPP